MKYSHYLKCFAGTILLFCVIQPFATETGSKGSIILTLVGVKSDQGGNMIAALYEGKKGWPDLEKAFSKKEIPVTADSLTMRIDSIPYDSTYAIQVIHDKNRNGKLDFRIFPFPSPKEGAGVSNNNVRNGPPLYKKATIRHFSKNTVVRIIMRY